MKARRSVSGERGERGLAAQALARVLRFDAPADLVLRRFFAAHPRMGRRDRLELAESVFDVLRNRRLYAHLAQSAEGTIEDRLLALSGRKQTIDASALPQAVRLSLPDWLHARLWAGRDAAEVERIGAAMLVPAPLDLRVNLARVSREAALASLRAEGIDCTASARLASAIRVTGKPALERSTAFRDGLIEVQDLGSQMVAQLLAPRRGQTVVDFCAGAGGKTLALAALLRGTGQVFACDMSAERLRRLRPRLARSAATNVQPFGIAHERDPKLARLAGRADAVLVDAPCSGTGTLRRNPDLKWRFVESRVAELQLKQVAILREAARLVCPGGALVYATCSLLDEENDEVRAAFERDHPDWTIESAPDLLRAQGAVLDPLLDAQCLRLRPESHDCDAFYAVRWRRSG
ncbi:MAG: RsmB/NOP family class I SAM-dependent RNA methyltransferase [Burkholderiaceae bacterium]|nr:RsmB/NOP family class I SAM-dependent RNA methyltransferase [Burkholderiaceae bacterium]